MNRQTTLGTTPLFIAASDDDLRMVSFLLRSGADKTVPDFQGTLPKDVAGPSTRDLPN